MSLAHTVARDELHPINAPSRWSASPPAGSSTKLPPPPSQDDAPRLFLAALPPEAPAPPPVQRLRFRHALDPLPLLRAGPPELEFALCRARRTSPARLTRPLPDEEWRDFSSSGRNPSGDFERWRHIQLLPPLFQRRPRDRRRQVPSSPTRRASPAPISPPRPERPNDPLPPSPNRGRVDHGKPVRFTVDGKEPRASPATPAGLGAAGERRPPDGPFVQVPPPARRRLRRLRRAERSFGTRRGAAA